MSSNLGINHLKYMEDICVLINNISNYIVEKTLECAEIVCSKPIYQVKTKSKFNRLLKVIMPLYEKPDYKFVWLFPNRTTKIH